jgi:hypothetical protein
MMTDGKLLEAAAKAAGFAYRWEPGLPFPQIEELEDGRLEWNFWHPLTDDGDALRLATQLRIDICFEKTHSVSAYTEDDEWFHEHCDQGKPEQILAKTRRAIVCAAASMSA